MAKIGRNAACPCGSGKKYKKCCLPADQLTAVHDHRDDHEHGGDCPNCGHAMRSLEIAPSSSANVIHELSAKVIDLLEAGLFEMAEATCRELKERFPDHIEWLACSAMVAETSGDPKAAADFYRRCIDFTYEHDGFTNDSRASMINAIQRLDPDGPLPRSGD